MMVCACACVVRRFWCSDRAGQPRRYTTGHCQHQAGKSQ